MKPLGRRYRYLGLISFGFLIILGCNQSLEKSAGSGVDSSDFSVASRNKEMRITRLGPDFVVDSAYNYTGQQVAFGPRIPGTDAHEKCAQYLLKKLKSFGLAAFFQEGNAKVYTGKSFPFKNIIASFHPEYTERILLSAHWDTRPFSDEDPDKKNKNKTFEGANDGASGIGILLEIARQIQIKNPKIGVDFIFWDIEDYGMKNDGEGEKTWCLGSRYWVANPPVKGYHPLYNINLDMVGGVGAVFNMEKASMNNDSKLVSSLWDLGNQLGYSSYFSYNKTNSPIIDDHVVVNDGSNIPAIDLIDYSDTQGFYKYWHKQGDNMSNLDKKVMKAVGQTVLENLYREGKTK